MNDGIDQRVAAVIELMERHLAEPISFDELATAVNLSPSYLTQLFRRATGKSPSRFWRELRLARARELLEASTLTARQAMDAVGWRDEDHLTRDIKQQDAPSPVPRRRRPRARTAEPPDSPDLVNQTDDPAPTPPEE